MSKTVHNPHDKFVRETFSDPERAQAFVEEFLPEKIVNELDLSRLQVSQDSYLDNEMKEYFSDLILKIPVKKAKNRNLKIAFLFEHKSSPDNYVLFQVGHYLFSHYFKIIRQSKKLELLIPLIYESTLKTLFVMKMSEKFKIEEEGKIFRRRSHSSVEERFFLMTKILDFAAICNRKGFSEWTHLLSGKTEMGSTEFIASF